MIVIIWAKYLQVNGYSGSLNLFKTSEKQYRCFYATFESAESLGAMAQQEGGACLKDRCEPREAPQHSALPSRNERQASEMDAIPREAPQHSAMPSRKKGQASETGAISRAAPNTALPSMHSHKLSTAQFLSFHHSDLVQIGMTALLRAQSKCITHTECLSCTFLFLRFHLRILVFLFFLLWSGFRGCFKIEGRLFC